MQKRSFLPVTVIGSGPDSDDLVIKHPFVAFHYQLMGPTNVVNIICVIERRYNTSTKQKACTPGTQTPPLNNIFWIRPQEVTHGTIMRHFLFPVYCSNLIHGNYVKPWWIISNTVKNNNDNHPSRLSNLV